MASADFIVIGGGVIGLSLAREIKRRRRSARVLLLEKETDWGSHASGRNSGVLHAGFYYSSDSLKARFAKLGNERLTRYCEERKLPILKCGKLVVAKDASELPALDELARRGKANGVQLEMISAGEAMKIEPRVKTFERALWSPTTSSVEPLTVLREMVKDAKAEGVELRLGEAYRVREGGGIRTDRERYEVGFVVNAAGLQADRIARDFGFGAKYRVLPFKGYYLHSSEPPGSLKVQVYPVPDLRYPFLGVHFTVKADGHVKIGPTAVPALWREQYGGLRRFRAGEALEVGWRTARLMIHSSFDFQRLAVEELRKRSRRRMVELAGRLLRGVEIGQYRAWGKPGIRAQLIDVGTGKLEMDFVLEGDGRSMHVLNVVSPGFTCALPFAEHVVDRIEQAARG